MGDQPGGEQIEKGTDKRAARVQEAIKNPLSGDAEAESSDATQGEISSLKDRVRGAEKWMIWLTGAIAFFALGSVVVGFLQWSAIKSGSTDTHTLAESAQKQAAKMGDMSDAAKNIQQAANGMVAEDKRLADDSHVSLESTASQNRTALNSSVEEFRLEHRAWVSLAEVIFARIAPDGNIGSVPINQLKVGDKALVNISFKNTGTTPAFNVSGGARLDIFLTTAPAFKPLPKSSSFGVLQPGEQIFQTISLEKLSPENVNAFNSGLTHIYGRVDYSDTFGIAHWSTFCRLILAGGAQAGCPEQPDKTDDETSKKAN